MLTIFYNKYTETISINNTKFSLEEFLSIGNLEKDFLKMDHIEVLYSEDLSYSKDINYSQDKIDNDLLIILDKISAKGENFYIQRRSEFDIPREQTLEELKTQKIAAVEYNYDESKKVCKIIYQGEVLIGAEKGLDVFIQNIIEFLSCEDGDYNDYRREDINNVKQYLYDIRKDIYKNKEIVKVQINTLTSREQVVNFTSDLQITIQPVIEILTEMLTLI